MKRLLIAVAVGLSGCSYGQRITKLETYTKNQTSVNGMIVNAIGEVDKNLKLTGRVLIDHINNPLVHTTTTTVMLMISSHTWYTEEKVESHEHESEQDTDWK